jgi:hypothetical protein
VKRSLSAPFFFPNEVRRFEEYPWILESIILPWTGSVENN